MDGLAREIRLAVRQFVRTPGFTVTALLILALGVGATTAMYAVLHATLLRPLPFPDADELAFVWGVAGPERAVRGASPIEIMDWRAATPAFEELSLYDELELTVTGDDGAADRIAAETVSASYFAMTGARPQLGRVLSAMDETPGAAPVAVISHELWQDRFGGGADVIGQLLRIGSASVEIVGVLEPGMRGISMSAQMWTTLAAIAPPAVFENRGNRWLAAVGRLRDGTTPETAQQQLDAAAAALARAHPDTNEERGAQLLPLRDQYVGDTRGLLLVLFGAVALLLVIAATNVASLLLVRGTARTREFAIRHALGASRMRVLRQLMIETTVLAFAGGLVGIVVAFWTVQLLLPLVPEGVLPPYAQVAITPVIALTGIAAALLAGMLAGLLPAFRSTTTTVRARIDEGGRGVHGGRHRLQHAFVAGEIALALVLLVAGGLMLRSFRNQLAIDPGFTADGVFAARFTLPAASYPEERRAVFLDELDASLRALPGVSAVSFTSDAPLRGASTASMLVLPDQPDRPVRHYRHQVSSDYFDVLGIRVLEGRVFTEADHATAPPVAVVSYALAQRAWPGESAIGKLIRIGADEVRVIGVVDAVRQRGLTIDLMDPAQDPDVYFHYRQWAVPSLDVLVQSTAPAASVTPAIRSVFRRADAGISIASVEPLAAALHRQTAAGRFGSFLLGAFGVLAIVLACTGVYGVLSFLVGLRRSELAVRLALGATPASVRRLVLREGGVVIGAGVLIGIAASLAAGRVLTTWLYGVAPADLATLVAVTVTMLFTAFGAMWVPAQRAARVPPQAAFRGD